ncbi:type I toxin-antitoxin system Fst family toxin [Lactobacillus johnsonii]|uniref:Type I toxin-antitoxin system Fst family toxin n=1 Tax=Lactobacillus johnsonii TaxID=33959 RepID=A0A6B9I021_LACJH|nr:type I toxin-antitoxin system Fst family toxin [Lactobacillus johnsonii]MBZ4026345.1 type I toxin-antitoxin system Fst family toxin [Lactobacillus johnsonii]MBZ4029003.1 type I toxin-antitoxin system Fst family toxin [Lactobacillus johnsonii]NME20410.1 type I toxin-antitoxin system Fst family toxin [Lactobacillus johnsonii]QGY96740.1 type I toxin-antitoxin system Fst family toxin [Lactobacillus johnsonii]HJE49257.1 type I toxin-antitoxin system Fst family toxin [Lactobacillus johnsonii]
MSLLKEFLTLVVAPILVEIVKSLFDHWLDDRHNNKKQ